MSELIRREIHFECPLVFTVEVDFNADCRIAAVNYRAAADVSEPDQARIFRACAYTMMLLFSSGDGFPVERNLGLIKGLPGFHLEHSIARAVFDASARLVAKQTIEIMRRGAA